MEGHMDAAHVNLVWAQEDKAQIGLPQISYCSPFTRCLVTSAITFGPQVYGNDAIKELNTVVVEVGVFFPAAMNLILIWYRTCTELP
jgi:hypothetical protein